MIELNGAGQTYLRAAGSLGWAFPASLGAKCAAGDRKVVCFTGDGGFYYHLAELESARRYNIPVAVIVNNNSGFGQNLTGVHRIGGDRADRGEGLIRFGPTDFSAVARSFGVCGIRVEEPGEIAAALKQAIAADGLSWSISSRPWSHAPPNPGRLRGNSVRHERASGDTWPCARCHRR
jgi:acetolactate synthase-1/2/3 large subunit